MAERKTYTEELTELKIAVAPIPEMKEDIKELVRAIKGNNGHLGVIARLAQQEQLSVRLDGELNDMRASCARHRKETNDIIDQKFDVLFTRIDEMHKERIAELEAEEDAREEEGREIRKGRRDFWIGLGLGLLPKIVDFVISILS